MANVKYFKEVATVLIVSEISASEVALATKLGIDCTLYADEKKTEPVMSVSASEYGSSMGSYGIGFKVDKEADTLTHMVTEVSDIDEFVQDNLRILTNLAKLEAQIKEDVAAKSDLVAAVTNSIEVVEG